MLSADKIKKSALLFLLFLFGLLLLPGGCRAHEGEVLKVTLLKVGKADAIVLRSGEQTMVMDAGEEDDGAELVKFLEKQGVSKVDVLLITHFDKDHVGGADTLVEAMEIGAVFLPDYEGEGTEYADFMDSLARKDVLPQRLQQPVEFTLGEASILVEPPRDRAENTGTADMDNNFSLITTITYGENWLLFTGDAEKERLREWLADGAAKDCDFLKAPHHGVYSKGLEELLAAVTPEYAAICSSAKHPAEQATLDVLAQYRVRTFQTKDGSITVTCDGKRVEVSQKTK